VLYEESVVLFVVGYIEMGLFDPLLVIVKRRITSVCQMHKYCDLVEKLAHQLNFILNLETIIFCKFYVR
jgi:hypothetical protein